MEKNVSNSGVAQFDPAAYKRGTREQWQNAAEAWHHWGPQLEAWLGPATEEMLDLAKVGTGSRVLDVGQPGPFSLGASGVLQQAYEQAGFSDVELKVVEAPLRMASAAECTRFERECFGALHQMLSGLPETEREEAWAEIETALGEFEGPGGFSGPCELIVGAGTK